MSASQHPLGPQRDREEDARADFRTATHEQLFEVQPETCDVCAADVSEPEADTGFDVRGSGLYIWTRGEEVRYEEPPLCASCAAAIGLSALARWEIEEEEG